MICRGLTVSPRIYNCYYKTNKGKLFLQNQITMIWIFLEGWACLLLTFGEATFARAFDIFVERKYSSLLSSYGLGRMSHCAPLLGYRLRKDKRIRLRHIVFITDVFLFFPALSDVCCYSYLSIMLSSFPVFRISFPFSLSSQFWKHFSVKFTYFLNFLNFSRWVWMNSHKRA